MNARVISRFRTALLPVLIASFAGGSLAAQDGFRFRSTTELINVTATVTDGTGRFASRLRKEDFLVREDGQRQQISHFSSERVPVSLGIVLDVSGSMAGEKFRAAQSALDRFLYDLLQPEDEVFILGFSDQSDMVSDWTTDRQQLANALRRLRPRGGTALYDAVAEAVPMAQGGRHKKKAVVVISDGNDTDSSTGADALQSLIRETEVLVYAIGIDGSGAGRTRARGQDSHRYGCRSLSRSRGIEVAADGIARNRAARREPTIRSTWKYSGRSRTTAAAAPR